MPIQQAFKPGGPAASVAPTTAGLAAQIFGDGENVLIYNGTNVPVQVDFGTVTFAAVATSPVVVAPGTHFLATVGRANPPAPGTPGVQLWAAALPIGTATGGSVYFTRGDGSTY